MMIAMAMSVHAVVFRAAVMMLNAFSAACSLA